MSTASWNAIVLRQLQLKVLYFLRASLQNRWPNHSQHDESRDTLTFIASARYENVASPCRSAKNGKGSRGLELDVAAELASDRGDILARGYWDRGVDYTRASDANQPSYSQWKTSSTLKSAETENKKKCIEPFLDQRHHFTPFAVSCEEIVGKEVVGKVPVIEIDYKEDGGIYLQRHKVENR